MATDRCRAGCRELRSAVSALQAKMRNQEELLMDLEERVATRDSGAHERLRVVEASMAALRSRIDLVDMMHPEETLEAKNFPAKATKGHERSPRSLKARDVQSEKLLDAQLEKRLVALEAGTEDALKCLRSDLNRVVSIAKANGSRLQALEAKEEPNSRIFSCVEGAAQVATRAFASLDSSVKSMELQVSSITASLTACGEEQQRQAMELKQLGHQVARLETSGASQVQLQGHLQGQLQDVHQLIHDWTLKQDDFQAAKEEFARQASVHSGHVLTAKLLRSMWGRFLHGVASGEPSNRAIVLWTRLTPTKDAKVPVRWQIWEGSNRSKLLLSGEEKAKEMHDFTVKVHVHSELFRPSVLYTYGFDCGVAKLAKSPLGQFRLPPAPSQPLHSLDYAIFSCANRGFGNFRAYSEAVDRSPQGLDFWLHLGDFIYESAEI
ncbi:unnamed protein product [Cladocopium goreaui]|uniref:Uncharacterized protein n=1 Tax=Cladocopium goreaui TaxID=2562237 RepID=A0A9P1DNE2_9DINO|nr:unnamed protein product [Cladocopium goreaui]